MATRSMLRTLLVALIACAATPAVADADGWVTVRYTGTYDELFVNEPQNPAAWQDTMHFTWDERQVFHLTGQRTVKAEPPQVSISGHVSSTYAPPNNNLDCSFDVVPRPQAPSPILFHWLGGPKAGATAMMPTSGEYAMDSGATSPRCGVAPNGVVAVGSPSTLPDSFLSVMALAVAADLSGTLGGPTVSRSYDAEGKSLDGRDTVSLHATMTIANSARKPANTAISPPKSRTPARTKAKIAALEAFKATFQRALYPCGVGAGAGTALIAAGPVGLAVGGTMSALGTPLCLAYLQTLKQEADTVADPPKTSYRSVARIAPVRAAPLKLPACPAAAGAGSPGAVCRAIGPRARTLLTRARETGAAARAIDTTISRETAALRAGSKKGIALQERTLSSLAPKFAARRRAESKAGKALAAVLRSAGLNVSLDATSGPAALAALQARLAARGLAAGKITTVLSGPPSVTAGDLVTAFGR